MNPETGTLEESSVLDGNCKLQWKADWGMRWAAFGVAYEMNGKDLIDSFRLSAQICEKIGGIPPENMVYELFLDEEGKKISKSKGNGISMKEWLKYAPPESLALYMFQSPQRAKRLYFDVIPNAMDDYIDSTQKFYNEPAEKGFDNPSFHIHNGNPPKYDGCLKFSMLLNLVQACSTSDENVLIQFVKKYADNSSDDAMKLMIRMASYAISYYNDFVASTRIPKKPDDLQYRALNALREELLKKGAHATIDDLQNVVFSVGQKFFEGDLKRWFETIYGVLFGSLNGPKIGSFIALYGIINTADLIMKRISHDGE
jgi:lysyl-tRNA synthetase class 1